MKISIIVPSFNQPEFIEETFKNLESLKDELYTLDVAVEILLFDSCSGEKVQNIIDKYRNLFDYIEIKKDKGQYDAINSGISRLTGDYWTWLNTDDLIDIEGCIKIIKTLTKNHDIDYIYGNTLLVDDKGNCIKKYTANNLSFNFLLNKSNTIVQPGSFFKTKFTNTIGLLKPFNCCFDYEYVLRILHNKGKVHHLNQVVSHFRYYQNSKSGSLELKFVNESLIISKIYKRNFFSKLTYGLYKTKVKIILKNILEG